jgi:hypothetical protein
MLRHPSTIAPDPRRAARRASGRAWLLGTVSLCAVAPAAVAAEVAIDLSRAIPTVAATAAARATSLQEATSRHGQEAVLAGQRFEILASGAAGALLEASSLVASGLAQANQAAAQIQAADDDAVAAVGQRAGATNIHARVVDTETRIAAGRITGSSATLTGNAIAAGALINGSVAEVAAALEPGQGAGAAGRIALGDDLAAEGALVAVTRQVADGIGTATPANTGDDRVDAAALVRDAAVTLVVSGGTIDGTATIKGNQIVAAFGGNKATDTVQATGGPALAGGLVAGSDQRLTGFAPEHAALNEAGVAYLDAGAVRLTGRAEVSGNIVTATGTGNEATNRVAVAGVAGIDGDAAPAGRADRTQAGDPALAADLAAATHQRTQAYVRAVERQGLGVDAARADLRGIAGGSLSLADNDVGAAAAHNVATTGVALSGAAYLHGTAAAQTVQQVDAGRGREGDVEALVHDLIQVGIGQGGVQGGEIALERNAITTQATLNRAVTALALDAATVDAGSRAAGGLAAGAGAVVDGAALGAVTVQGGRGDTDASAIMAAPEVLLQSNRYALGEGTSDSRFTAADNRIQGDARGNEATTGASIAATSLDAPAGVVTAQRLDGATASVSTLMARGGGLPGGVIARVGNRGDAARLGVALTGNAVAGGATGNLATGQLGLDTVNMAPAARRPAGPVALSPTQPSSLTAEGALLAAQFLHAQSVRAELEDQWIYGRLDLAGGHLASSSLVASGNAIEGAARGNVASGTLEAAATNVTLPQGGRAFAALGAAQSASVADGIVARVDGAEIGVDTGGVDSTAAATIRADDDRIAATAQANAATSALTVAATTLQAPATAAPTATLGAEGREAAIDGATLAVADAQANQGPVTATLASGGKAIVTAGSADTALDESGLGADRNTLRAEASGNTGQQALTASGADLAATAMLGSHQLNQGSVRASLAEAGGQGQARVGVDAGDATVSALGVSDDTLAAAAVGNAGAGKLAVSAGAHLAGTGGAAVASAGSVQADLGIAALQLGLGDVRAEAGAATVDVAAGRLVQSAVAVDGNRLTAGAQGNLRDGSLAFGGNALGADGATPSLALSTTQQQAGRVTARLGGAGAPVGAFARVGELGEGSAARLESNALGALAVGNEVTQRLQATASTALGMADAQGLSRFAIDAARLEGPIASLVEQRADATASAVEGARVELDAGARLVRGAVATLDGNSIESTAMGSRAGNAVTLDAGTVARTGGALATLQTQDGVVTSRVGDVAIDARAALLAGTISLSSNRVTSLASGNDAVNALTVTAAAIEGRGSLQGIMAALARGIAMGADYLLANRQDGDAAVTAEARQVTLAPGGATTKAASVAVEANVVAVQARGQAAANVLNLESERGSAATALVLNRQSRGAADVTATAEGVRIGAGEGDAGPGGAGMLVDGNQVAVDAVANEASNVLNAGSGGGAPGGGYAVVNVQAVTGGRVTATARDVTIGAAAGSTATTRAGTGGNVVVVEAGGNRATNTLNATAAGGGGQMRLESQQTVSGAQIVATADRVTIANDPRGSGGSGGNAIVARAVGNAVVNVGSTGVRRP